MELQFQKEQIPCLRQVKSQVQTQEQTQEIHLSESLPDVGRVLCTWGQVVVRGKEWQSDFMGVNCGVMVWVLYAPEDGSPAQCVETWIPLSLRWDLQDGSENGRILCHPMLKSVDARVTSQRKLMVRATVGVLGQAFQKDTVCAYIPDRIPSDIYLKERGQKVTFVGEMGEKPFIMDEEVTIPESSPAMDKIIRYALTPEVTDKKVLGDKAVFRGNTLLHVLYRTVEGAIHAHDFEIPFSQYSELEQEYGHDAQVQVLPMVTSLELEMGEQGRIRLKAGLSGQYVIYDTREIPLVEDGYSPDKRITLEVQSVQIPRISQRQSQRIRQEQTAPFGSSRVVDVSCLSGICRTQYRGDNMLMELPGSFQVLYYDREGILQAAVVHWQSDMSLETEGSGDTAVFCIPSGKATAVPGEESTLLRGEILTETVTAETETLAMAVSLQIGEEVEKDPHRPSLILRRAGHENLWDLAKQNGSTVQAIRNANSLAGEPEPDQMILIPIL